MKVEVIREGKTCWKTAPLEQSAVLVDAQIYYSAFCKAALLARRHIYLTGWQFDTQARLLRPEQEALPPHPIELLPFLNFLCERTPALEIFVTAWDYSVFYALEREWLQKLKFDFQSHSRVHFEFLNHPETGGCHHQKIAIIDGEVAFVGGLDLCDSRWDTREHVKGDPNRLDVNGRPYKPFHDVQLAVRGPVIDVLTQLFREGWRQAHGQELPSPAAEIAPRERLPGLDPFELSRLTDGAGLALRARSVAVSRTEFIDASSPVICEVQALFEQAILAAERLIYLETQYFTSRAMAEALCLRLTDPARSKLQIIMVMPDGADSPKEDFVLGDRQRGVRRLIAEVARHNGHAFRLLMSSDASVGEAVPATFIHSKLMIVDDELLTIGSANFTNRSMRIDRELNLAFETRLEASAEAGELHADIRSLRADLLCEHAGTESPEYFADLDGLIERLDYVCNQDGSKLRCQTLPEPKGDSPLLIAIFDPSAPLDWNTFDQTLEEAFDFDESFIKRTAQKVGQRLGVVDVDR